MSISPFDSALYGTLFSDPEVSAAFSDSTTIGAMLDVEAALARVQGRLGIAVSDFDVIELNEAFAKQDLAVMCDLGIADDAEHVNSNGGAIALERV